MFESILILGIYFMFFFVPFILALPLTYVYLKFKGYYKKSFKQFLKEI